MRAAENRICILDQSAVHGSVAECTRIRCSAVESGTSLDSDGPLQLLRADRKICGPGLRKSSVAS